MYIVQLIDIPIFEGTFKEALAKLQVILRFREDEEVFMIDKQTGEVIF